MCGCIAMALRTKWTFLSSFIWSHSLIYEWVLCPKMLFLCRQFTRFWGSPVSGPNGVWPMRRWNMFPPDAHYVPMRTPFIPQCSSPHPPTLPHSVTLSSVTVKWVRWYWAKGLSALIFLSHSILIHSILLETIALIWDSHREHMWPLTCWGDISCVPFKVGCGTFLLDISSFRPLNVSSSEVCKMTQSRREMLAFVLQVCSYPWR